MCTILSHTGERHDLLTSWFMILSSVLLLNSLDLELLCVSVLGLFHTSVWCQTHSFSQTCYSAASFLPSSVMHTCPVHILQLGKMLCWLQCSTSFYECCLRLQLGKLFNPLLMAEDSYGTSTCISCLNQCWAPECSGPHSLTTPGCSAGQAATILHGPTTQWRETEAGLSSITLVVNFGTTL